MKCNLFSDTRDPQSPEGQKGFQNPDHRGKKNEKPNEPQTSKPNQKNDNEGTGEKREEVNKMIFETLERNRISNVFYEELELLELMGSSNRNTTNSGFYNGFTVECPTSEKREEKNRRILQIKKAMDKIKDIKKKPDYDENELSEQLRLINRIKAEFMTELKFFGGAGKDADAFNYGREQVKGSLDEQLTLPYKRYELFQFPTISIDSKTTREHNFVFTGVKRGAILKGGIRLLHLDGHHKKQDALNEEFEFTIYKRFLMQLFHDTCQIKVRFYINRALNLAAQSNAIELKYRLGGYQALSSADPYPVVCVGDSKNDINSGVLKTHSDEKEPARQTLNPEFYRDYDLDSFLPADWKLVLMIYNKEQFLMDRLIGEREIDIEDRYYANLFRLRTYALEKRGEDYKETIKILTGLNPAPHTMITACEEKTREMQQYLKPLIQTRPVQPIEFCFLTQPGQNTMQGSAEILLETLNLSEIRKVPRAKFEPPKPVKYQIRMIIWEAFDIPKGDRKAIDVFFKVTLDNEGWTVAEVTKETDTHLGSDGYCIYNWRMTFDLQLPCAFPRLKIVAYDMATFGSDESIGEVTLKFDNIMPRLKSEGRYEAPQQKQKLKNPKKGGEEAGDVLISLKIIQSSEAASVPVGDGQDEPNTDPVLEKPKLGRGIGDFLKGLDFKINFSFGLLFTIMKYMSLAGAALTIFAVLFINPGLLK